MTATVTLFNLSMQFSLLQVESGRLPLAVENFTVVNGLDHHSDLVYCLRFNSTGSRVLCKVNLYERQDMN